jgi:hypothetical protein
MSAVRYCVNRNANPTGEHEVHSYGCGHMPDPQNQVFLGIFPHCRNAVAEARRRGFNADGCFYCSNECHSK